MKIVLDDDPEGSVYVTADNSGTKVCFTLHPANGIPSTTIQVYRESLAALLRLFL